MNASTRQAFCPPFLIRIVTCLLLPGSRSVNAERGLPGFQVPSENLGLQKETANTPSDYPGHTPRRCLTELKQMPAEPVKLTHRFRFSGTSRLADKLELPNRVLSAIPEGLCNFEAYLNLLFEGGQPLLPTTP